MMTKTINNLRKKGVFKTFFLITLAVLLSCEDTETSTDTEIIKTIPIAAFTETVDVADWKTYNFTNRSTNALEYAWDFGDGTSSSEEQPSKTFAIGGSYTVKLTVSNASSTTDTVESIIEVFNPNAPKADFTAIQDTNDWKIYKFTNQSVNSVSYAWDFGDNTASTDAEPSKTFAGAGTFVVKLTATGVASDFDTLEKTIKVVDPNAPIPATKAAVLLNGSIDEFTGDKNDNNDAWETDPPNSLKDGSASPYLWDNIGLSGLGKKAAGITTGKHTGEYALKFDSDVRRAYQPFEVEVGVEYTISMYVKAETADDFNIYILNNEVQDENDLAGNSDKVFTIKPTTSYVEYSFTFKPTTTAAVFYAVPFSAVDGDSEVFLDDISIATPGF